MVTLQQLLDRARERSNAKSGNIIGEIMDMALQAKKALELAKALRPIPSAAPGGASLPPSGAPSLPELQRAAFGIEPLQLLQQLAYQQPAAMRAAMPPPVQHPLIPPGPEFRAPGDFYGQAQPVPPGLQQAYQQAGFNLAVGMAAERNIAPYAEAMQRQQQTMFEDVMGRELTPLDLLFAGGMPGIAAKFLAGEATGRLLGGRIGGERGEEIGGLAGGLLAFPAAGLAAKGARLAEQAAPGTALKLRGVPAVAGGAREEVPLIEKMLAGKPRYEPSGPAMEEVFWGAETVGRSRGQLVDDLTKYLREFTVYAEEKVGLRHTQLQQKAAMLAAQRGGAKGMPGLEEAAGILAGKQPLPGMGVPATRFSVPEANELAGMIIDANLRPITYAGTAIAFRKAFLLGEELTLSEITRIGRVFGPKLAEALLEQKKLPTKALYQILDIVNFPRAILASADFSYPLRQAMIPTVMHPIEARKAFVDMFKAIDEKKAAQMADDLAHHPNAGWWETFGLETAVPWKAGERALREDPFVSGLIDKGRLWGFIRMSQRVFVTYGNKLRAEMFETYARNWNSIGRTFESHPQDYRALARWCNISTGRGEVAWIKDMLPSLNALFFSPRLVISRIQMPIEMFTSKGLARQVVIRDLIGFTTANLTILSALKASGLAEVELDPRSSDFGKVKIGRTRLDFWGGFQPIVRYTAQLLSGHAKYPARPGVPKIVDIDWKTTVGRFLWSKMAPGPGLGVDIVRGQTFIGQAIDTQPVHIKEQMFNRLVPLFIQDLVDATRQEGLKGMLLGMPGVFGVGVQTYERTGAKEIAFLEEIEGVLTDDEKSALQRGIVPNIIREMPEWKAIQEEKAEERRQKPAAQKYQADLDVRNNVIQQASEQWEAGTITGVEARKTVADARNSFRIQNEARDFPGGGFLDAYYKATYDRATDPETQQLDYEKLDEYIAEWDASATAEERAAVSQHELAADSAMERLMRADRVYIRDSGYWENDESLWEYAEKTGLLVDGKRVKPPSDVHELQEFLAGYAEWKTKELIAGGTPQDQAVTVAWGHARNLPFVKTFNKMLSAKRADDREADDRLREALLRWYKAMSQEEMERYGYPVGQ